MKKILAIAAALVVLSIGAMAFAHGPGGGPRGGGYGGCGGPGGGAGYDSGPGYGGGGFMWGLADTDEGKKFLKDTEKLRKKLHDKRFELKEAYLAGDDKKAEAIEKEIDELREQLWEKAEKSGINKNRGKRGRGGPGYGGRGGPGYGGCGGPGNCGGPGGGF